MNFTKIMIKTALGALLLMGFGGCSKTVEPTEIMSVNQTALDGYDPVAYFVSSQALQADGSYVYAYAGLNWNFASAANMERFKADPASYIPAFGGFCAYQLADGDLVLSDPAYWYIHNGRLYLFEDEDAKNEWFKDIDMMLLKGEESWKALTAPAEEEQFEEIGDTFMNAASSAKEE